MGSCFSKKKGSSPPAGVAASAPAALAVADFKSRPSVPAKQELVEEESKVKKEIFIIKHRKSHDERDRSIHVPVPVHVPVQQKDDGVAAATENHNQVSMDDRKATEAPAGTVVRVRTASCNKEEVDAILIQCGRLSRTSSGKAASSSSASCDRGKKYSGSKRSYDFDNCENDYQVAATCEDGNDHHHRQRHRQSPQGRRRTPSRERNQQQRSSSRERRTSRSPGRRLSMEQNNTTAVSANANSDPAGTGTNRPGKMKMISVPATVSKTSNGESATTGSIKRISVKRNAGEAVNVVVGSRTAASPRSQSPARGGSNTKAPNDSLQQQPSLSRSSSRKAEQSPYRRNPLNELDPNSLAHTQAHINNTNNKSATNVVNQLKPSVEINCNKIVAQGINYKSSTASSAVDNKVMEPAGASGADCLKPHILTRSRSSRRSRDLDINPEILCNPPPSYTRLLLEDIQNFHQQSNAPVVSLPPCMTKACSIVEAVADLNSSTNSSNMTSAFSAERNHINKSILDSNLVQRKDVPFVESEVLADIDILEPSFHKYVTVRRGGADMEDQESSGSNSFVSGSQQPHQWGNSSSWEPNSADSTDCWTSRSNTREDDRSFDKDEAARRRPSGRKTDGYNTHSGGGIGRGRLGASAKGLHTMPVVAAAAST